MVSSAHPPITPRLDLNFRLDDSVPRHWFAGDAFKTRLFDAMSLTFPEGERFFIACVRDFADDIQDPLMRDDVRHFSQQEAQHRRAHQHFNQRLAAQGVKVDKIEANTRTVLFDFCRQRLSPARTLAMTAAAEHLTAIMSHNLFERAHVFADADPRVRALLAWHAVEEVEHKGVAFDVLQNVAHGSYLLRTSALLQVTLSYTFQLAQIMNHMFKVDGYSRRQRWGLWARGLWWLWGPQGLLTPLIGAYLAWFKPGYHPWQTPMPAGFAGWSLQLQRTGDPVTAADALIT
jgi:predicted metal-dependent hydrolase